MSKALLPAVCALSVALAGCANDRARSGGPSASTPAPAAPSIRVAGPPGTIPAGTRLDVRTNETINSSKGEGQTYNAQIDTDVVGADGNVLLPKGSPVELVVMETREKGGVRGAGLRMGMRSVTVNGNTYLVISEEVERSTGLGKNSETAQKVGGGAALGTVIGAAAGGGKGAVIGGLAGAAAGALAQVLTQGKEVRIPAETVLQFRLDEPVQLQRATP